MLPIMQALKLQPNTDIQTLYVAEKAEASKEVNLISIMKTTQNKSLL